MDSLIAPTAINNNVSSRYPQQFILSKSLCCEYDRFRCKLYVGATIYYVFDRIDVSTTHLGVGRILSFGNDEHGNHAILVNHYSPLEKMAYSSNAQSLPLPPFNVIPELMETLHNRWILIEDIFDLCFIFHYTLIKDGFVICHGTYNCYHVRYKESDDASNYLLDIDYSSFHVYPSTNPTLNVDDCIHSIVYKMISRVQKCVTVLLNRRSSQQKELLNHSDKIIITNTCWNYILQQFSTIVKAHPYKYRRQNKLSIFNDLSRKLYVHESNLTILRFETKAQLQRFSSVFGFVTIIGSRMDKPDPNGDFKDLLDQNVLNYIIGNDTIEPFRRYSKKPGIDLIRKESGSFEEQELIITIRYRKSVFYDSMLHIDRHQLNVREIYSADPILDLVSLPSTNIVKKIHPNIRPGAIFRYNNGHLYKIKSFNKLHIVIERRSKDSVLEILHVTDFQLISDCIKQFNS